MTGKTSRGPAAPAIAAGLDEWTDPTADADGNPIGDRDDRDCAGPIGPHRPDPIARRRADERAERIASTRAWLDDHAGNRG